ncbi:MAG: hypothetical protein V8R81_08015 [Clostridia bacterium]
MKKICAFYASDYHFEMISLPYIEENLEKRKEIIILTENDLQDTIKTLISNINIEEKKKQSLEQINWKNDDLNKFKKIKKDTEENKDVIIFIKGKENYIRNINKNIEKWTSKNNKVKIVDCYDMNEVSEKVDTLMEKYKIMLGTAGEKVIENI